MAKRNIRTNVIKGLLARSGNQCAYPDCTHPIFNDENLLIAQLCHIYAVSPGGPRFNEKQTNGEKNGYDNLLFLCYRHHKETDEVEKYPPFRLQEIKKAHESKFSGEIFVADQHMINQIKDEISKYWSEIQDMYKSDDTGLIFEINTKSSVDILVKEILLKLSWIEETNDLLIENAHTLPGETYSFLKKLKYDLTPFNTVPYYQNPLENRHWELLNIGIPNSLSLIKLRLLQIELRYYQEYCQNNPAEEESRKYLKRISENFKEEFGNSLYND